MILASQSESNTPIDRRSSWPEELQYRKLKDPARDVDREPLLRHCLV